MVSFKVGLGFFSFEYIRVDIGVFRVVVVGFGFYFGVILIVIWGLGFFRA